MDEHKEAASAGHSRAACTCEFTVIAIAWIRPEEAKARQNPHHGERR